MAHSKSAKKRIRQNEARRLRNRRRKADIKEAVHNVDTVVASGNAADAAESLKTAYKKLDKVAAKGTIHKRTAARKKSRLAKRLNKVAAE